MHEHPASANKTQVRQLLVMQKHVCSERDIVELQQSTDLLICIPHTLVLKLKT